MQSWCECQTLLNQSSFSAVWTIINKKHHKYSKSQTGGCPHLPKPLRSPAPTPPPSIPSPVQADEQAAPLLLLLALVLQVGEHLSEVVRVRVDLQHLGAHQVDNGQAAVPEGLLGALNQERLERVRDFIAHVGVRQVEAGEQHGLQLVLRGHFRGDHIAAQHVDKDHIGGGDESLVLPTLEQQGAVNTSQPQHWVSGWQVLQPVTTSAQKVPKAAQQLTGGGLDDHSLRGARGHIGVCQGGLLDRRCRCVGVLGESWSALILGEGGQVGAWLRLLQVLVVQVGNIVLVGAVGLHLLGAFLLCWHRYDPLPGEHVDERVALQVLVFGVLAVLDSCVVAHGGWSIFKQSRLSVARWQR